MCVYIYKTFLSQGIIKVHLPSCAFLECAEGEDQHTLFGKIGDTRNVKKTDLEKYLELVVKMYELSPEGTCFFQYGCSMSHAVNWQKKLPLARARHVFCR